MHDQIASQSPEPRLPHRPLHGLDGVSPHATATPPGHWARLRRPVRQLDHALHRDATEWVLQLPESLRPANTCARYPRIVNLIVDAWLRGDHCRHLFEQLLSDRRPARRGFPLSVRQELRALAAFRLEGVLPAAQAE